MRKHDWYFKQLVSEGDLDEAFDDVERAIRYTTTDNQLVGIAGGGDLAPADPANLTVILETPVIANDDQGRRIFIASANPIDVSVDSNLVSTAVLTPGNSKIVSVFIEFDVQLSNPQNDGNSQEVFYDIDESFNIIVVQGAEAVNPTPPALQAGWLLCGDITRTHGQTQIIADNISMARQQVIFKLSSPNYIVETGTFPDAIETVLGIFDAHIEDLGAAHDAAAIGYVDGSGGWANASGIAATNVQDAIDEIVDDLGASSGAARVGFDPTSIPAAWLLTKPSTNIQAAIANAVADLGAANQSKGGYLVGFDGNDADAGWTSLAASTSLTDALFAVTADLGSTASTRGAKLIGFDGSGNHTAATVLDALADCGVLGQNNNWGVGTTQTFGTVQVSTELFVNEAKIRWSTHDPGGGWDGPVREASLISEGAIPIGGQVVVPITSNTSDPYLIDDIPVNCVVALKLETLATSCNGFDLADLASWRLERSNAVAIRAGSTYTSIAESAAVVAVSAGNAITITPEISGQIIRLRITYDPTEVGFQSRIFTTVLITVIEWD